MDIAANHKVQKLLDQRDYKGVIEFLRKQEAQSPLNEEQLRYLAHAYMAEGNTQDALAILEQVKTPTSYGKRIEGWCYLKVEDWEKALSAFEKALELENDPRNYFGVCVALLRGRYTADVSYDERPRLLEILEAAVSQEGCFPECFAWLDDIRWMRRYGHNIDPQVSIGLLEKAIKLYPDDEQLKYNLSRWLAHKDKEKALDILKPILEGPSPSGTIYCAAIRLCEYLDRFDSALSYLEQAEKKGLVEGPPKDLYNGYLLLKLNRLDDALKAYEAALLSEDDDCKINALFGRSLIYLEKSNRYIALRNATEAVSLWWSNVGTNDRLGDFLPWVWCWFSPSDYSNRNTLEYKVLEVINRVITLLDVDLNDLTNVFNVGLRYLRYLIQDHTNPDTSEPDITVLQRVATLKPTRRSYYKLSEAFKNTGNFTKALEYHLRYCIVSYKESKTFYVDFDLYDKEYEPIDLKKIAQKHAVGMHKAAINLMEESTDPSIREAVFKPFYDAFWQDLLDAKKMYKELRDVSSKLLEQFPDDLGLLWDYAYYSYETKNITESERAYRKLISLNPKNGSAFHNLALIIDRKGAFNEALELSDKAVALAPTDENICNLNENLRKKAEGYREAKQKWDSLDYYKRKLLRVLKAIGGYESYADLASRAGIEEKYIAGHLRRLTEQQWIIEDGPNRYHLNEYVSLLVKLPEPPYMSSTKPTLEAIDTVLSIPGEGTYELIKPLIGYKKELERRLTKYPFAKNVFLMMRFRESNKELGEYLIESLAAHGLRGVRADLNEWNITKNVYNPIAVLYCCKYGIALFDEAEEGQAYSPNVAYELGIMHYQKKECLILRHASLPAVPFDLIKDLYFTYNRDLKVKELIKHWIEQVINQG